MGRAEPNVRPAGAKSPSGKPIYVVEIATPVAAVAAGERLRKEPRGIWTCVSLQSTRHNYNYNSYNLLAIVSSFGLHLSKIHSRCSTNRQRRRVRRRLNMSVINTGVCVRRPLDGQAPQRSAHFLLFVGRALCPNRKVLA